MKQIMLLSCAITAVVAAAEARAQVPAYVKQVHTSAIEVDAGRLETYARLYFRGVYDTLAVVARQDIRKTGFNGREGEPAVLSSYVSVVFVGTPPVQKNRVIVRFLLPPAGDVVAGPQRIPGETTVYEILLSYNPAAELESAWVSTAEEMPIRGQLVKLAETVLPPAAAIAEALSLESIAPTPPRVRPFHVTVNKVTLPRKRAVVQIATRIVEPEDLRKRAQLLKVELLRGPARISACAMDLALELSEFVATRSSTNNGFIDAATLEGTSDTMARKIEIKLNSPLCKQEVAVAADGALAVARAEAVMTVGTRFMALSSGGAEPVTSTAEIRNVPHSKWSVGLVGGGMVTRGGDSNFEISNKALQRKNLSGAVTAAVLHWHPYGYDPMETDISWGERTSLFAGFATTPSAGLATGVSLRFFRGLGIQASHVWLRANRLRQGFEPGQEVAGGSDPFELGFTRALVLGISYDIK